MQFYRRGTRAGKRNFICSINFIKKSLIFILSNITHKHMKKYILLTALLFLGLGLILIEFNYQLAVSEARQSEGTDEAGERAFYERGFLTPETTKARATYNFLTMDCKYKIHYCNWGDCDHIGTSNFKQRWNNPKNTAGHYAELLHFYNPDLSYEEVEEIILFPTESGAIEQAVNE